ncbi:MAG: NAD(P)-binding domain-containing protein [Candidatus Dormibacteraeota bacterium]|nr:NAD(P)-binding domain-containing protein [Candidatus Dormibacteraeota bacterium]
MIVDGGNSNYHDSIRRAAHYAELGFLYLDIGVLGASGAWRSGTA